MKLHCERERLLTACQLASVAVPARDAKPVLRNVKASAEHDCCTLQATDLELGIRLEIRGLSVEEPGEALFPAGRLLAILRESPDEELAVKADGQASWIQGRDNEFEMPSEDPASFPELPTVDGDAYHEIEAGKLKDMIRRTCFAAAADNHHFALNGTLWELSDKILRLVASDGRRLAVAEGMATPHEAHAAKAQPYIVPTKAMHLLERNLHDPEEKVRVRLRPNDVLFQMDRATIYSRLVEGRFPAYKSVLPKDPTTTVPLVAASFHAAVRQAAVMTENDAKRVLFRFEPKRLLLQAQSADVGRSQVELPIEFTGKSLEITFDPKLLTDMLRVLDGTETLTLEMTTGNAPARFRYGDSYSYIVMPLCTAA